MILIISIKINKVIFSLLVISIKNNIYLYNKITSKLLCYFNLLKKIK